jgi:hypothetical protein
MMQSERKTAVLSRPVFGMAILILIDLGARVAWWRFIEMKPLGGYMNISFDLWDWSTIAKTLWQGQNPYVATRLVKHAPFWLECLFFLTRAALYSGFSIIECVRATLLLSDLILLTCLDWLIRQLNPIYDRRFLLFGYCLNPFLMILTIQHGNFDLIAVIWIVLFLGTLMHFRRHQEATTWLCAAALLGIGVLTKTFPLILWPLLAGGIRALNLRTRLLGAALVVLPFMLALLPIYVLAPEGVTQSVFEYRSLGAEFGMISLCRIVFGSSLATTYAGWSTRMLLVASAGIAIWQAWRPLTQDRSLVLLAAAILLAVFTIGPGYGSQYWFWVIPLYIVCCATYSRSFCSIVAGVGLVVVCTNVVEYGFSDVLGQFWLCHWPTHTAESFGRWLNDYSNEIWLRLPMTLCTLGLLVYSACVILGAKNQTPSIKPN